MANSNGGNRTNVDRELGRMDQEYGAFNNNARGGPGDFGNSSSNRLRGEVESGYRSGGARSQFNPMSLEGIGGGGYGGDVSWNDSKLGDTGSARSTYEDFSRGGGVDANAMRRANTIIPSFYDGYKRNAQRRMSAQGGYAPGFDAQMAEVGRAAGREGHNASLQTEGQIAQMTQQGRLAGASGLMGLGGMETQNNQFNTSGQFGAAEGNANRRQSANQFGAGMSMDAARFNEDGRRFDLGFNEDNRRYGQGGLRELYDNDRGEYYQNQDNYLRGIGGRSANAQNLIFGRTEPTSGFENTMRSLGPLAGAGMSLIGMGGRRRPSSNGDLYNSLG